MKITMLKRCLMAGFLTVSMVCQSMALPALATGPVGSDYQKLAAQLDKDLDTFVTQLDNAPKTHNTPLYGAELMTANSNIGINLLGEYNFSHGVTNELQRDQQLGIQLVVIDIDFPIFYQPYYSSQWSPGASCYQEFVSFYKQVVQLAHSMGIKVAVESQSLLPSTPGMNCTSYFQSFNNNAQTFSTAVAQHNAVLASQIHPDYLCIVDEISSQAINTYQTLYNTPSSVAQLVQQSISAVQATGTTGVQFVAGMGCWQENCSGFATALAEIPALNAIDCQFYPPGTNGVFYNQNAFTIANIAKQYGKKITVSEAWCHKTDSACGVLELPPGDAAGNAAEEARDTYSFWVNLDCKFLHAISEFAKRENAEFQSSFTNEFWSYLPYSEVGNLPDTQVNALENTADVANRAAGILTQTGLYYGKMITDRSP